MSLPNPISSSAVGNSFFAMNGIFKKFWFVWHLKVSIIYLKYFRTVGAGSSCSGRRSGEQCFTALKISGIGRGLNNTNLDRWYAANHNKYWQRLGSTLQVAIYVFIMLEISHRSAGRNIQNRVEREKLGFLSQVHRPGTWSTWYVSPPDEVKKVNDVPVDSGFQSNVLLPQVLCKIWARNQNIKESITYTIMHLSSPFRMFFIVYHREDIVYARHESKR